MGFVRWELPIGPRCSCPLHSGSCEAAALLPSRSLRWLDPATHPNWGPHAASARSAGPFRQITPPRCQAASQLHLEGNRSLEVDMLTGHGRSTPVGTGGSVSRGRSASVGGHRSVSTGEGARAPASCSQLELAPWACAGVHVSSQFQCMQTSGGPPSRRSCLHLSSLFRAGRAVHLPKLPVLMSERPTEPMQDRSGADLRSNNADALPY